MSVNNALFASLLCIIFPGCRAASNRFQSTFGVTFNFQNEFLPAYSYLRLRNNLKQYDHNTDNSTNLILIKHDQLPIRYGDLVYWFNRPVEQSSQQAANSSRICHLNVFNTDELNDIYIDYNNLSVSTISWICKPYAWCCGAECCQYGFKSPMHVLGPDIYSITAAVLLFVIILIILETVQRIKLKIAAKPTKMEVINGFESDNQKEKLTTLS